MEIKINKLTEAQLGLITDVVCFLNCEREYGETGGKSFVVFTGLNDDDMEETCEELKSRREDLRLGGYDRLEIDTDLTEAQEDFLRKQVIKSYDGAIAKLEAYINRLENAEMVAFHSARIERHAATIERLEENMELNGEEEAREDEKTIARLKREIRESIHAVRNSK